MDARGRMLTIWLDERWRKSMRDFTLNVLAANPGRTGLFFVGQAGFIARSAGGQILGLDLYLSDCVERVERSNGYKRLQPKLLGAGDLTFDLLIATHPHRDHFDVDSIPLLMANRRTQLCASLKCRPDVERMEIEDARVHYVRPGDRHICGDFVVDFIPCDHGAGTPDAVGAVIAVDGKRICAVGDTCLRHDWIQAYQTKGPFDVLIAPINGTYGNLNERECAQLSGALRPKLVIPCHFGMFASHGGNPGLFKSIMDGEYPDLRYEFMCPGEGLFL